MRSWSRSSAVISSARRVFQASLILMLFGKRCQLVFLGEYQNIGEIKSKSNLQESRHAVRDEQIERVCKTGHEVEGLDPKRRRADVGWAHHGRLRGQHYH